MRFDQTTRKWDENFAYAIQPVFQISENQPFIIAGQFQLPLFAGQMPSSIKNAKNPMKTLNILVNKQSVNCVDFVQLISRVGSLKSAEPYVLRWWPDVDT